MIPAVVEGERDRVGGRRRSMAAPTERDEPRPNQGPICKYFDRNGVT